MKYKRNNSRCFPKGSFTLKQSGAELSKDHNKATAVVSKLQHSNASQSVDMPL